MKLYIIHEESLDQRLPYLNGTVQKLKELSKNMDIQIIRDAKSSDLNMKDINEHTRLEKINDDDFDKQISPINKCQVSNILKHCKAYEMIIKNNENGWIIEDDAVISNDYANNLKEFLFKPIECKYDILFNGFTIKDESDQKLNFINNTYKILPSKCSYLISPKLATDLLIFLKTYRYNMRISLSRFLYDNKDKYINICANKYMLLDASKIGILPTSINNNNMLIYNPDYVRMIQLIKDDIDISKAKEYYNKLARLESPDVNHLMGILYHKTKDYDRAKEYLLEAIKLNEKKQGYIGKHSEILNNCINIFQYNQEY